MRGTGSQQRDPGFAKGVAVGALAGSILGKSGRQPAEPSGAGHSGEDNSLKGCWGCAVGVVLVVAALVFIAVIVWMIWVIRGDHSAADSAHAIQSPLLLILDAL